MKKIWNLPSYPVYSISTVDEAGEFNMNICTYAIPVSMKPKQYVVAIYYETKTHKNIQSTNTFFLQLLSSSQKKLITPLGRKSGMTSSKSPLILKNSTVIDGFAVLKDCVGYLKMKIIQRISTSGDHELMVCEVVNSTTLNTLQDLLYWSM